MDCLAKTHLIRFFFSGRDMCEVATSQSGASASMSCFTARSPGMI